MKTRIGIIGGVGPQATSHIYKMVVRECSRTGAIHNDDYPDIIIHSLPIPDFISDESRIDTALSMIQSSLRYMEDAGCEYYCIASNTVHLLQPLLMTKLRFISMIDLVSAVARNNRIKRTAIVCSPTLNKSNLYRDSLELNGVHLIRLSKEEEKETEKQIRSVISGSTKVLPGYERVLMQLALKSKNIIIGCTELSILTGCYGSFENVLDSDSILAEKLAQLGMKTAH